MNTYLKLKMLRGSESKEKISRHLRDLSDCSQLSDAYLLKNCSINRAIFHQLLIILEPVLPKRQRSTGIPFPLKVRQNILFNGLNGFVPNNFESLDLFCIIS